jgi:hypothetical protein
MFVVRTTTIAKWKISKVRTAIEVLRKKRDKDSLKISCSLQNSRKESFCNCTHLYIYISS